MFISCFTSSTIFCLLSVKLGSVSQSVQLFLYLCMCAYSMSYLTLTTVNSEHEVTHNNILCRRNEYNSWNTTHFKIIIDLLWTFAASNNSNVHAIIILQYYNCLHVLLFTAYIVQLHWSRASTVVGNHHFCEANNGVIMPTDKLYNTGSLQFTWESSCDAHRSA